MRSKPRRKENGFTLIEILIVLVIISIVTTIALVNLKTNENRNLQNFTNELSQILTLVEEQALLRPSVLALKVEKSNYEVFSYNADAKTEKKESIWKLITDDELLASHKIPDNIDLRIVMGDEEKNNTEEESIEPQIIFSTNGDVTPFAIYVSAQGEEPRYMIRGEANGKIEAKKLS